MIMDQDKFLALIDNLFLRKGVPVSINISKYVRKKIKDSLLGLSFIHLLIQHELLVFWFHYYYKLIK